MTVVNDYTAEVSYSHRSSILAPSQEVSLPVRRQLLKLCLSKLKIPECTPLDRDTSVRGTVRFRTAIGRSEVRRSQVT